MSFYLHTIQLDTNYHEPLTYHRLEILYNQNNIDSQMYSSLHVVLVYTNENNVNNDRYNFEESADDFCANVFVFVDGKLMIESAMVEVRPEMSYVFVSKSDDAFLVLKSISGEIRYIKVRKEEGEGKRLTRCARAKSGRAPCDAGAERRAGLRARAARKFHAPL